MNWCIDKDINVGTDSEKQEDFWSRKPRSGPPPAPSTLTTSFSHENAALEEEVFRPSSQGKEVPGAGPELW